MKTNKKIQNLLFSYKFLVLKKICQLTKPLKPKKVCFLKITPNNFMMNYVFITETKSAN